MEYKLMIENVNINENKESIIDYEDGIVNSNECIICFEGTTDEDKVEPIKNFYIMPDCYCSYNVHGKCIQEWQHIQQQQVLNRDRRKFYCLKCNSKVLLKAKWEKKSIDENYRRNNMHVACVIISCIFGLVLLMMFIGLIVQP